MTTQLKAAEAELAAALIAFDRVENEVTTYTAQLAEATANEQTLRERRDLEALTTATARRIALENLLAQAEAELDPARDRLLAAEAAANRERAAIAAIPLVEKVAQTEAEMIAKLDELEAIISRGIEELVTLEDRLSDERSAYYRVALAVSPSLQSRDLVARGGRPLPRAFDIIEERAGMILPTHPLGPTQCNRNPQIWRIFHGFLSRRLAASLSQEERNRAVLGRQY